jgi:hypothetical protein
MRLAVEAVWIEKVSAFLYPVTGNFIKIEPSRPFMSTVGPVKSAVYPLNSLRCQQGMRMCRAGNRNKSYRDVFHKFQAVLVNSFEVHICMAQSHFLLLKTIRNGPELIAPRNA